MKSRFYLAPNIGKFDMKIHFPWGKKLPWEIIFREAIFSSTKEYLNDEYIFLSLPLLFIWKMVFRDNHFLSDQTILCDKYIFLCLCLLFICQTLLKN